MQIWGCGAQANATKYHPQTHRRSKKRALPGSAITARGAGATPPPCSSSTIRCISIFRFFFLSLWECLFLYHLFAIFYPYSAARNSRPALPNAQLTIGTNYHVHTCII